MSICFDSMQHAHAVLDLVGICRVRWMRGRFISSKEREKRDTCLSNIVIRLEYMHSPSLECRDGVHNHAKKVTCR